MREDLISRQAAYRAGCDGKPLMVALNEEVAT